ncbi:MAG: hypothetical protein COA97_07340 [Flavobacteriales bacterium]|nr:MAG: hypothetical protein COA97_07340 [Flavobacteriales bacterium]
MKELHNHIFSNTTCISKETMLKYINKQLVKNELYQVEKHMLDCELCSDAYEGIQFAQNSSIIFAIDNQIDKRVEMGNYKAPIMKNLMVAASILVIVFGAYFTFNYFNATINNESELAINEVEKSEQPEVMEERKMLNNEVNVQNNIAAKKGKLLEAVKNEEEPIQDAKYRARVDIPKSDAVAQDLEISEDYDMEDEMAANLKGEVKVIAGITSKIKEESAKSLELLDEVDANEVDNRREDDFSTELLSKTNFSNNKPEGSAFNDPATDKAVVPLKKSEKKSKSKTRSRNNKQRKFKSVAEAPAMNDSPSEEEMEDSRDRNQQKIVVIDSYKIVDYTEEYQKDYDLKNTNTIETTSISAGYESKEDKDVAEKEKDELIIEVTYKETLEKAIRFYKNKKYTLAIEQFDIILEAHPDEVNGLFYEGMSNYHLQRYNTAKTKLDLVIKNKETEFNEEAKWYKALILIDLKEIDKAKVLLKSISSKNGFYKTKAIERLKGL